MGQESLRAVFDKWCKKLRLVPGWDVKLEFVTDPNWPGTGGFKFDCSDKTAILMLSFGIWRQ